MPGVRGGCVTDVADHAALLHHVSSDNTIYGYNDPQGVINVI